MTKIQKILFEYQDSKYGDFSAKLVPTLPRECFIGVRSPSYKEILRELASLPQDEIDQFKKSLPHQYHEENCLQIALINKIKDYDECVSQLELFLPYINSWAVSDGLNPPVLKKNKNKLLPKLKSWIKDEKPFTKRVGMLLLMKYFLDDDFKPEYLELVKQWDYALPFIQDKKLAPWTHNKAIQKACESLRISPEQKEYLKSLKVDLPVSKK